MRFNWPGLSWRPPSPLRCLVGAAPKGPLLGATRSGTSDERAQARLMAHMDGLRTPYDDGRAF